MRHRKRGRRLGRSSSHRRAMLRNLASSLFLTERDEELYKFMVQADGKTPVSAPVRKGRVVTTLEKAKEARSLVERCITIAKRSIKHQEAAEQFETNAERNTDEWKAWRQSEQWQKWNAAIAPVVAARRRVFALLRDAEAVAILFDDIAPRYVDRPGGYTRVMRLALPRFGDAGTRAILELVGENDRVAAAAHEPAFGDDDDAQDEGSSTAVVDESAGESQAETSETDVDASPEDAGDESNEEKK